MISSNATARKQTLWTYNEHDDHDRIDHEGTERGHIVFAGHIADSKQQRGQKGAGNAGGATNCDHDQEIDHELQWKRRIQSDDLGAKRAPETGEARTNGKGDGK